MKKQKYILIAVLGTFAPKSEQTTQAAKTEQIDFEEMIRTSPDIKMIDGEPYINLRAFEITLEVDTSFLSTDKFLDAINAVKQYSNKAVIVEVDEP